MFATVGSRVGRYRPPIVGNFFPGGRLTLASATPIMTTSQSGKTSIKYAISAHNLMPVLVGNTWLAVPFTELSNDTTASAVGRAGPAAVAANKNYDMFTWRDGGINRLSRGAPWNSDTARSSGTENDLMYNGMLVNKNSITNGPAAGQGLYVGTVRSDGSSQINWTYAGVSAGGTAGVLGVWNQFNRERFASIVGDSTASWNYATTGWRQQNASAGNQISIVVGGVSDQVFARSYGFSAVASSAAIFKSGIGVDSTTTNSAQIQQSDIAVVSSGFATTMGEYAGYPGLGWHTLAHLEWGGANGATYGSGEGNQTGMVVEFWA